MMSRTRRRTRQPGQRRVPDGKQWDGTHVKGKVRLIRYGDTTRYGVSDEPSTRHMNSRQRRLADQAAIEEGMHDE